MALRSWGQQWWCLWIGNGYSLTTVAWHYSVKCAYEKLREIINDWIAIGIWVRVLATAGGWWDKDNFWQHSRENSMHGNRLKSCVRKKKITSSQGQILEFPSLKAKWRMTITELKTRVSHNFYCILCLPALKDSVGKSYGVAKRWQSWDRQINGKLKDKKVKEDIEKAVI